MKQAKLKKTIFLTALISIFLLSSASAFAEEDAGTTPDSLLYGLDKAFEKINLAFTFDKVKKIEKRLKIASERIAELKEMVDKGKSAAVNKALKGYNEEMEKAEKDIETAKAKGKDITEISKKIADTTLNHISVLNALLDKVPEQAKAGIQNAIEKSTQGKEKALANIGKDKASLEDIGKPDETGKPETTGKP